MGFQRPTSNWLAGFLPSTVRPFFACWVHLKFNTRGTWETIFGSHPWPCHSKLPSSLLGYNACWPARVKNRLQSHFLCEFGSLFEFIQNWVCHECPLAIGGTTCWVLNIKIEYARNIPVHCSKSMVKTTKNEDVQTDLLPLTGGDSWRLLQFPEHCGNSGPETENWFHAQKMRTVWIFELLAKTEHVESPRKTSTFPIDQVKKMRLAGYQSGVLHWFMELNIISQVVIIWMFPKIGVPQNGKTLSKWMIWGYHYFWKHPYMNNELCLYFVQLSSTVVALF